MTPTNQADGRETNRLYAMSTDKTFVHAFLNPLVIVLAKQLYKVGSSVSTIIRDIAVQLTPGRSGINRTYEV